MISHPVWIGLGAAIGWLSFLSQHLTVSLLDVGSGRVVFVWLALGMILRWTAVVLLLFVGLRSDFLFGLSAAVGLFLARWLALINYTRRLAKEA